MFMDVLKVFSNWICEDVKFVRKDGSIVLLVLMRLVLMILVGFFFS